MRPFLVLLLVCLATRSANAESLQLLFLGDNGHHRPVERFHQLEPVLAKRGIELKYTDDVGVLNLESLNKFDGLVLYANIDRIEPAAAEALLAYVESGKGFVPLHCATFCFRNDARIIALMGGLFQRHGGEVFTTVIAEPEHPVMRDYGSFTSWDETYVHTQHNTKNRTVLEYRVTGMQAEGQDREPWTWVRTQGKGRVFYTAWGHDQRTWSNPGFSNLVERGIRWACGDDPAKAGPYHDPTAFDVPAMTRLPEGKEPFDYIDVGPKIPNYTPSAKWGTQGEPNTRMQKPLSAEQSQQRYVTPAGFHLELFASEPDLGAKPISMNWDERGRLWVCETIDYPNELQPGNKGRDRIEIVEDTDGDGRGDKFTIFADSLSIPTAILPFEDSCVVQNGTETLWLADTNGDGKADVRQVLISNWAMGDTHGGVSNFRLGLDNWVYGMQGYNNSAPVINGEKQQSFRMGFFRFKLSPVVNHRVKVTELEFLRSTNNNTWGLGISEDGLIFGSTANNCPSVYLPIPNRYYERVKGWSPEVLQMIADSNRFQPITDKVRQVDQFGGYTAGAGHALYTARNYPTQWWNRVAFVCGPTGHLVGTFVLNRDGADFHSTSPFNLVASDDEWVAPIMAEVGPDGNVWVLDWYNYIVQHNPTPHGFETGKGNAYESDLRDKRHGRIYRVVYDASPESKIESLEGASPEQLVAALRSPTMLVRLNVQRLLIARGQDDVVPALNELISDQAVDAAGLNVGAIHALWTLQGLGQLTKSGPAQIAALHALAHPSAGVRRNAIQALFSHGVEFGAMVASGLVRDTDAQVRLAALLALADQAPSDGAGNVLASLMTDSSVASDRWLDDALTSAAAVHSTSFLKWLLAAQSDRLQTLSERDRQTVRIVAEHLARGRPSADDLRPLVIALGKAPAGLMGDVLAGLSKGWDRQHKIRLDDAFEAALSQTLQNAPDSAKGQVIQLASLWGSKELARHMEAIAVSLLRVAEDDSQSVATRLDSARQLVGIQPGNAEVVDELLELITPQAAPELSAGLLEILGNSTADEAGELIVSRTRSMTPAAKQAAIRTLLARTSTASALVNGIESGAIQLTDLSLDQKRALSEHPEKSLREQALKLMAAGGGLPNADRQRVVEELLPLTRVTGDVEAGLAVFKKHCMKCHKHGDIGETIGPNLTGMAVHPKAELLIHIMDPSRSVEGNFRLYQVVTVDGKLVTGMLASETRTSLELIDTEAKRHAIQRDEIEELVSSPKSIMPEGFEKQMTPDDLTNLLEFLTNKGKYLPLDLRKVASINSTQPMFHNGNADPERLIFPDWGPKSFKDVPFLLVDPQGDRVPNVLMLRGRNGDKAPGMPTAAMLPVNAPAAAIHLLSGVGGWSYPAFRDETPSLRVRIKYANGKTEDHDLINGIHFADYIRRVDVPGSEFAFAVRGQQVRYLKIVPAQPDEVIAELEFIKPTPDDPVAPIVVAVTVETP